MNIIYALIFGFILWPLTGLLYVGVWNILVIVTKSHPTLFRHWYECLLGCGIMLIEDIIRVTFRNSESKF